MKYIIEIKPEYEGTTKGIIVLGIKNNCLCVDELAIEELEELNSDYINENFGELQDTAYQRGLKDAWEAARRISVIELNGGLNGREMMKIYGTMDVHKIYDDNTASEAIEKLKAYEEKQKADDKIEVGDEVEVLNSGSKYLIAWIAGTSICGFSHDGVTCHLQPSDVRKTGRHFDIASILEEMRK